jgi:hypothetical protein
VLDSLRDAVADAACRARHSASPAAAASVVEAQQHSFHGDKDQQKPPLLPLLPPPNGVIVHHGVPNRAGGSLRIITGPSYNAVL